MCLWDRFKLRKHAEQAIYKRWKRWFQHRAMMEPERENLDSSLIRLPAGDTCDSRESCPSCDFQDNLAKVFVGLHQQMGIHRLF